MAGGNARERTSLIVTVLDEVDTIESLLESIASQTRPPDQVIVVDGGSTDGTWQKLESWTARLPLRVEQAPGANIARGRNVGIAAATSDLIAVTDAGVRLAPDWLEHLLARLKPDVDFVSGFFKANPRTTFERAMGATVLPTLDDVDPGKFLPSSRSVLFRRGAWLSAGRYPEWLDYGEDLVFDLAALHAGCRFAFVPSAIAWITPRSSLPAFFRQYYLYARGDGKANLWPIRHLIRYLTYSIAVYILWRRDWTALLLIMGGLAYVRRPYQRLQPMTLPGAERWYALALVPLIRLVGDVAKMLGYPVGIGWRLTRRWTCRSSS